MEPFLWGLPRPGRECISCNRRDVDECYLFELWDAAACSHGRWADCHHPAAFGAAPHSRGTRLAGNSNTAICHKVMLINRIFHILSIAFLVFMIISLVLSIAASGKFGNNPHQPDLATGHEIALSVRGLGTVYLTQAEWSSVAPYWNTFLFV